MCMGFTAVTKRSGIDGQNEEDLISRLGCQNAGDRNDSREKSMSLHLIADVNVTSYASNSDFAVESYSLAA